MSDAPAAPEFSRMVDRRELTGKPITIEASETERAALAQRFGLVGVNRLSATVSLEEVGEDILASGRIAADIIQSCAVSGDDLPISIDEPIAFRFVPAHDTDTEEVELEDEELDEIFFERTAFDLGEAVAQSLALAIDPYATGPNAETARQEHDLIEKAPDGPLQRALGAALKKGS